MATTLNAGTSTGGAAVSADATGILQLQTGSTPTTAVTIDTSQNVGIGTSSPAGRLHVVGTNDQIRAGNGTNTAFFGASGSSGYTGTLTNDPFIFYTNSAERMRIDSSGNVGIGATPSGTTRLALRNNSLTSTSRAANNMLSIATFGNGADANISFTDSIAFNTWIGQNNGGAYVVCVVNGVRLPNGASAWVSDSDERFKDIIEPITGALDKVSTLRTVIGKYKTDEEDARRPFLIAQDVQAVFPEAVYAQKDEAETLGVAYTEIIPLLTKAIQELKAELDATKAEVAALKGTA